MAAVILGYTALNNFTTETIPSDFSVPDPRTGEEPDGWWDVVPRALVH